MRRLCGKCGKRRLTRDLAGREETGRDTESVCVCECESWSRERRALSHPGDWRCGDAEDDRAHESGDAAEDDTEEGEEELPFDVEDSSRTRETIQQVRKPVRLHQGAARTTAAEW